MERRSLGLLAVTVFISLTLTQTRTRPETNAVSALTVINNPPMVPGH
ncbi:MAG: hypothetical protein AB7U82_08770 [Blastocatellales bacterium]